MNLGNSVVNFGFELFRTLQDDENHHSRWFSSRAISTITGTFILINRMVMNTCNITFTHPVKGIAYLSDSQKKVKRVLRAETDNNFIIKIPLVDLEKGKWTVIFVWEYDGRQYDCKRLITRA